MSIRSSLVGAAVPWAALCACGDNELPPPAVLGQCGEVASVPTEPGAHVSPGASISWSSNPPVTGAHYPAWAGWDRFYAHLDRGYWVHNLEHGGVVLLYHCPQGCAEELAALRQLVRDQPVDARCNGAVRNRFLIVADPELPTKVRFAAAAWGAHYTATCLDRIALEAFAAAHYARAPEDLCGDGLALGGEVIP